MFQRILVAVDGSEGGRTAVATAGAMAALTGATVRILHVDPSDVVYDTVVALEDDGTAHRVVDGAVASLRQAGVAAEGELLDGLVPDVAAAVSEAADRFGADLVVLAPHHRSRLAAWFSPRVSDQVSHRSAVPVLLAGGTP
ncbi:universal stress protein [Kitasatospora sp. NPDC059571]|uniref:universal stress protein n=1 Tax=Kitasatospora sp. NPDC059571 TaxID=3346871 RepID=UPI00368B5A5D